MDLFRRRGVRGGDDVVAEDSHADGPALARNVVNRVSGIVLLAGGSRSEIAVETLAVDMADENFREGQRSVGAQGVGHAMDGEGRLVQVALELKTGGVDESLIRGIVRDGVLIEMRMRAQRPQIEIDDAIGLGKQAGRFGRSLFSQKRREREQQNDDYNGEDGRLGAPSHEGEINQTPMARQKRRPVVRRAPKDPPAQTNHSIRQEGLPCEGFLGKHFCGLRSLLVNR